MLNLVERRLATITPKEAANMLEERNTYEGQRPFRQAHADFLARKMKEGLFLQAEIAYAKLPDGRWVLENGQHSLIACVKSGVPFNASIYGYECQDETELFTLYSETDQGMRRTTADVMRAGRNIMPADVREIPLGQITLYGAAILMAPDKGVEPKFNSRSITAQARVAAVRSRPAETLFLHECQGGKMLNRIPVRMAMVATYRADARRARLFWNGVANPDDLPIGDPRRLLSFKLLGARTGILSAVAVREIYVHCLHHWNAYVSREQVGQYDLQEVQSANQPAASEAPTYSVHPPLPIRSAAPAQTTAG